MAQARLNGQVLQDGGLTCVVYFQWGTTTRYEFETAQQGGMTAGMMFYDVVYNLAEAVVYHFRAVAKNSRTVVYGNDASFIVPVGSLIPVLLDDADLAQILGVFK
jgi:hypothetical protein